MGRKKTIPRMTLKQLASRIMDDWSPMPMDANMSVSAMWSYDSVAIGSEDEALAVRKFLSESNYWRGRLSREVKNELRNRLEEWDGKVRRVQKSRSGRSGKTMRTM